MMTCPPGIVGETVGVVSTMVTRDVYGVPSRTEAVEYVGNVLVAPADTAAIAQLGQGTTWELHWPKADHRDLRGAVLIVRGERFAVVGDPRPYQTDLVPGDWDRPVHARRWSEDGDA